MTLMFDENDVTITAHPLARRMRKVFFARKLTSDEFSRLVREYGLKDGKNEENIRTLRNNLYRLIHDQNRTTYRCFEFILKKILGLTDDDIELVLKDNDPDTVTINKRTLESLVHGAEQYVERLKELIPSEPSAAVDEAGLRESYEAYFEEVGGALQTTYGLLGWTNRTI